MSSDAVRPGADAVRTDAQGAAPARPPEESLLGFARALRAAGVAVTADRERTFLEAVAALGLEDQVGVYHAGRATLCGSPADLERYDLVFHAWFSGQRAGMKNRPPLQQVTSQAGLNDSAGAANSAQDDPDTVAAQASSTEILRHRDVATLDRRDREELVRMFAALRPRAPRRRAHRHTRAAGATAGWTRARRRPRGPRGAAPPATRGPGAAGGPPAVPCARPCAAWGSPARWSGADGPTGPDGWCCSSTSRAP